MNELLGLLSIKDISLTAFVVSMALLVITDKLVWHKRLSKAEERADKWERIAWEALTTGAQAGVTAAEVAAGVVSALPDPSAKKVT